MIDNGEETEFEAVRGHLFMLLAMSGMAADETYGISVHRHEDGEFVVSLECAKGRTTYPLYRQRGEDAERKCQSCADYLVKEITADSLEKHMSR